jgi:3-oxoadipate CoA-transferase, beta subunit
MKRMTREQVVELAAKDLPKGSIVNLGIGLPTSVVKFIAPEQNVWLHSENGIVGMVPLSKGQKSDPDLINASKQPVALVPGASICDHVTSFSMMRGGHLDISVLGAFEVAANGDLANWSLGGDDPLPSVGGAMDLAIGAREVWVVMEAQTKDGRARLVDQCSLPLTGAAVVSRVYTDIGVFDVRNGAFVPRSLVPGLTDAELRLLVAGRCEARPPGMENRVTSASVVVASEGSL